MIPGEEAWQPTRAGKSGPADASYTGNVEWLATAVAQNSTGFSKNSRSRPDVRGFFFAVRRILARILQQVRGNRI